MRNSDSTNALSSLTRGREYEGFTPSLFVTSFVAYDVSAIVKALNDASMRGVGISMLLESSQDHGGSVSFDVIGKMRVLVPSAKLYAWRERAAAFADGRVHAKVAVADGDVCFITSANLTGHAMEQNMEAGVLISGGQKPQVVVRTFAGVDRYENGDFCLKRTCMPGCAVGGADRAKPGWGHPRSGYWPGDGAAAGKPRNRFARSSARGW